MALGITGVTLSIEFGDTNYGAGTKSFFSLHARAPEGDPIPLDSPNEAIAAGLDMYLTAWTTLMNGRLAVRTVTKEEFDKGMEKVKERIAKLKVRLYEP
jgi:hypothetical protein